MAFLVSYSESPPDDHPRNKAIYLEQAFYEMIWKSCRGDETEFSILGAIASIGYKSPVFTIASDRLDSLVSELGQLEKICQHHQIIEFRKVCEKAIANSYALTVSGDMHPELG